MNWQEMQNFNLFLSNFKDYSSYRSEKLPQRGKQTAALEISSWRLLSLLWWKILGCPSKVCGVVYSQLFYIFCHITCSSQTGGSGTIVPPYLRGQLGVTSAHRRILIQALNGPHCQPCSHTGLGLGHFCVWFTKQKNGAPWIWMKHCLFPVSVISLHIPGLWMMGHNVSQEDNPAINHTDERWHRENCSFFILWSAFVWFSSVNLFISLIYFDGMIEQ